MNDTLNQEVKVEEGRVRKQILDQKGRAWGSGKRKAARVSVRISPGNGKITVNGKDYLDYFKSRPIYTEKEVSRPFSAAGMTFDVDVKARGGGLHGQGDAIRLALARAIVHYNPLLYPALRSHDLITPDTRVVQSKKYGYVKARKTKPTSRR